MLRARSALNLRSVPPPTRGRPREAEERSACVEPPGDLPSGRRVTEVAHEGGQRFLTATGRPFRPRLSGSMSGCSAEPQELRRGRDRCFRSVAIDLTERVAPRSVPSSLLRRHQRGAGGPISRVLRHPALSVSSTVRTASRSTCGVGLSVSRLIPTSDYPTRTFTSALSSVSRHRPEEHQSSLPG